MHNMRIFVCQLPKNTLVGIHESYTKFEGQGFVGNINAPCRVEALRFLSEHQITDSNLALWMDRLAFEVYRRLAVESLEA